MNWCRQRVRVAVAAAFEALGENSNSIVGKVDPVAVEDIYRTFIIPLTKEIELAHLFQRCGGQTPTKSI